MVNRVAAIGALLAAFFVVNCSLFAQSGGPNELMPLQTNSTGTLPDGGMTSFATISGSVRTSDNAPLANARIEIREIGTGKSVAVGYSGPAGTFQMAHIARGRYEVVATSGLAEAREEMRVDGMDASITLRLPHTDSSDGGKHTISVAEMRIPDKAKREVEKAREAMSKEKQDDARKHLAKALEIAPGYSEALTLRGLLSLSNGDMQAASNDFGSAIKNDSNAATAYVAMGALYNLQQKFDDAIRELQRGISLNPSSWQGHFEMSKAMLGKGDFEDALRQSTKAEELSSDEYGPIHLVKGHALLGLKSYNEAIGEFEKYLSLDKDGAASAEVRQQLQEARSFASNAKK